MSNNVRHAAAPLRRSESGPVGVAATRFSTDVVGKGAEFTVSAL